MLIWIIDEEWKDYDVEKEVLEAKYPGVEIRRSTYDYEKGSEGIWLSRGRDSCSSVCFHS